MLVLAVVMGATCVAQAFGRFTYGVVLPAVREDLLGSNRAAGLIGTRNVAGYLAVTLAVATVSARVGPVTMVRAGLCLSTAGLLLASLAHSGAVLGLAMVAMGLGRAAIWIPSPGWPRRSSLRADGVSPPGSWAWASAWAPCSPVGWPTCSASATATRRGRTSTPSRP